jgi:hypothetical protein
MKTGIFPFDRTKIMELVRTNLNVDNNSSSNVEDQARKIASEIIEIRLKPMQNRGKKKLQLQKNKVYDGRDIIILSKQKEKILKKKEEDQKKKRIEKEQRKSLRYFSI